MAKTACTESKSQHTATISPLTSIASWKIINFKEMGDSGGRCCNGPPPRSCTAHSRDAGLPVSGYHVPRDVPSRLRFRRPTRRVKIHIDRLHVANSNERSRDGTRKRKPSNHGAACMQSDGKYWFPAKRYGYGWGIPTTWQGWLVLAV